VRRKEDKIREQTQSREKYKIGTEEKTLPKPLLSFGCIKDEFVPSCLSALAATETVLPASYLPELVQAMNENKEKNYAAKMAVRKKKDLQPWRYTKVRA
jgi:hypothetical protein